MEEKQTINNIRLSKILEEKKKHKFYDHIFNSDISLSNINRELEFNNCVFKNKFTISKKKKKITSFIGCKFQELRLENVDIKNTIKFENCEIEKFILKNVDFEFIFSFINTKVTKKIELDHVEFSEETFFNESAINDKLDLTKTIFYKQKFFYKLKTEVVNRETARIIKDSFEKQNNIIEANKFYALEMIEREKELSPQKDFFEWIVFKTHGLVSNHSQDWVLVLFWIISLTFMTSFIKIIDSNIPQLTEKIVLLFIVTAIVFFININISNTKKIYYIICSSIYYILYAVFTKDCTLNIFSNTINPFSIMTGKEELTFGILLYKITIAYLIYQLIISIRQNTRRK